MTKAWMVRAGRRGEREEDALRHGLAVAGWPEMDDLNGYATRRELHVAVREAYPHRSPTVVANWTGQLWRLLYGMAEGDFVVIPLKATVTDKVAIGRIVGPYLYRSDADPDRRHVRPVEWINPAIARSAIQQDLLYSLGSLLTICSLQRNGAVRRIAALAETGTDPGPTADELSASEWTTPDAFLEDAYLAEAGLTMTVRDLLTHWGASRRTSAAVTAIEGDLGDRGLVTVPPFTEGWIDDTIVVIKSGAEADDTSEETPVERAIEDQVGEDPEPEKPFTLRFGNLLRSNTKVASVRPSDSLNTARTLMLRYNYSQLAVIDNGGHFSGAISWESIAKRAMSGIADTVRHATEVVSVAEHAELALPRIDEISTKGFVFVRSADGKTIAGIVTSADLADRFGEIAKPFSMIEECERRLKRRVADCFSDDFVSQVTNKRYKTVANLTLGAYPHLLHEPKHFEMLGWPLDHRQFVDQVKEVATIRNKMMHFSPDPIPTNEWGAIDGLLAMLHAVDPLL